MYTQNITIRTDCDSGRIDRKSVKNTSPFINQWPSICAHDEGFELGIYGSTFELFPRLNFEPDAWRSGTNEGTKVLQRQN
jgi:hypothetical protein